MKEAFVQKFGNLLKATTEEERKQAKIDLHHQIVSTKIEGDIDFETTMKNDIIHQIKNYVEEPTENNRLMLAPYLEGFTSLIKE